MKTLKLLSLTVAVAAAMTASEAYAVLSDNLVSYWQFEENLLDSHGSNDGMYSSLRPESYAPGPAGKGMAIDLSGNDTASNSVIIPEDPSLKFGTDEGGDGNVSISAWFKVDSFTKGWQALVAQGEDRAWRIARRGGDTNELGYAGGIGEAGAYGGDHVDGEWHHVAAVTNHENWTRMYVDGALVAERGPEMTDDDPPVALPTLQISRDIADGGAKDHVGNAFLMIGDNPDTGDRAWDGWIDEVAIYNRVLSAGEVRQLADGASAAAPEPGSIALACIAGLTLLGVRRKMS